MLTLPVLLPTPKRTKALGTTRARASGPPSVYPPWTRMVWIYPQSMSRSHTFTSSAWVHLPLPTRKTLDHGLSKLSNAKPRLVFIHLSLLTVLSGLADWLVHVPSSRDLRSHRSIVYPHPSSYLFPHKYGCAYLPARRYPCHPCDCSRE